MNITLSDTIAQQLQKRVEESTDFDSVDAYVNYVLEEVIKQTQTEEEKAFTQEEEKEVKNRLHDLGYLD